MKPSPEELEAESWAFALEVYARPGAAEACLKLQNDAGVDVMMMLVIVFAAVKLRVRLTAAEVAELDHVCRPWREQIVHPLRAIRAGLKVGPLPAPNRETEQFRANIKTAELAAERLQNQLLTENLPLRPPKPQEVSAEELRSILRSVVAFFLEQRESGTDVDLVPAIDKIVDAATHETH